MKAGKRKFDKVEDRYYTKDLASKHLKQRHTPGAKDSKTKGSKGKPADGKAVIKNLKAVNRKVFQLAKQMGKAAVGDDETSHSTNSDSSAEVKSKSGSNRMNPAFTRQKKATISEKKWHSSCPTSLTMLRTLGSLDVVVGETNTDLNSHAEQCAVGSNSTQLIVNDYERPINLTGIK